MPQNNSAITIRGNIGNRHLLAVSEAVCFLLALLGINYCIYAEDSLDSSARTTVEPERQVSSELPQSSQEYLGNWYTLGRVSGKRTWFNFFTPALYDMDNSLLNLLHVTIGSDRFEQGFTLLSGLYEDGRDNPPFMLMLPQYHLLAAPTPGNRLSLELITPNTSLTFGDEFATGMEEDFLLNCRLRWDFISRKGAIRVQSDQYELAFHYGPQLNAGQLRVTAETINPHSLVTDFDDRFFNVKGNVAVGVNDHLTLSASFTRKEENYVYFYPDDTISLSTALEYRSSRFMANTSYELILPKVTTAIPSEINRNTILNIPQQVHTIRSDLALLLGSRINALSEVNGNFDGYFRSQVGEKQLLVQLAPMLVMERDTGYGNRMLFIVSDAVRHGVTKHFTIGQEGFFYGNDDFISKNLLVTATYSNIPLRTRGPEGVSKFEYQFGYWPRAGEFNISGKYRLPLFERMRMSGDPEVLTNADEIRLYPFLDSYSTIDTRYSFMLTSPDIPTFGIPDLSLSIVAGLHRLLILSNNLVISNLEYDDVASRYNVSTTKASTITDEFRILVGNPEKSLHSIGATLAWREMRVDSYYNNSGPYYDPFELFISYIFTRGF